MDSLFLLQFACFIFMLINAFIVALSHLHVRWENKRYERSRWMIVAALIGLAIQYVLQMTFGFRAMHDNLGAVINILLYTPCFSLISIGIYNIETTRANLRKMILMCSETDGYSYHNEKTIQHHRDIMKDHILSKYGLHLLRLSTKGSGEREKIVTALNKIDNIQSSKRC